MKTKMHMFAGMVAMACIATFFVSTVIVELFGSPENIVQVKSLILMPGLFILIPAIAMTGGSGFNLGKERKGKLVEGKKKRMPFIAANGILILIPAAFFLEKWAAAGSFDAKFYIVQIAELVAGATNLFLMGLQARDGRKLTGKK